MTQAEFKPRDPATLDSLREIAAEVEAARNDDGRKREQSFRIAQLYRRAAELPPVDAAALAQFLGEYLLRDCMNADRQQEEGAASRYSLRELLGRWLDSLPEPVLWHARQALTERIVQQLAQDPSPDALYTLTAIGFRDLATVGALRLVASGENDLADLALRLMAAIKVEGDDLSWFRARVNQRFSAGAPSAELLNAIASAPDDQAIDRLREAAVVTDGDWLTFPRLARLCEHAPGDLTWQDRVWNAIVAAADARPNGWRELLFSGGTFGLCQSPEVIQTLIRRMPDLARSGQLVVHWLANQIEKMGGPQQVAGIGRLSSDAAVELLRNYATASSGQVDTPGLTADGLAKRNAWEVALFLGSPLVYGWIEEAISGEGNTYGQHNLMNDLAALSSPVLPARAIALMGPDLEFRRDGDDRDVLPYLAAMSMVASRLSTESLDMLLKAGGLIDGHPFAVPVEEAAHLAIWLVKHGDHSVINRLVGALSSRRLLGVCIAAKALRGIAATDARDIGSNARLALGALVLDPDQPPYVRADAIAAYIAGGADTRLNARVAELCGHEDEHLRTTAAVALIDAGALDSHRGAIEACAFRAGRPSSGDLNQITDYEAFVIGRLAAVDPALYGRETAAIIERMFTVAVSEAIRGVRSGLSRLDTAPAVVVDAIVSRLYRSESRAWSAPYLFWALALLGPRRLLSEPWHTKWDKWMPDSRRALADEVANAARTLHEPWAHGSAIEIATQLLHDGIFAVRRSAARALATLGEPALLDLCHAWVRSGSIALRIRAAEAAGWISLDSDTTLDNAVLRQLSCDAERSVRRAAERSREDLRRRLWAAAHFAALRSIDDSDPGRWVLANYARGVALAQIGDDRDLTVLRARAERQDLAPNVRHWFGRVAEQLERRWRKTTSEWPDPWLPWTGAIEELAGTLVADATEYAAQFSLWLMPPRADGGRASWGGAASFPGSSSPVGLFLALGKHGDGVRLRIAGRNEALAMVVATTGSDVVLSGSGPYPEQPRSA